MRDLLKWSILALSQPAEVQLGLFPDFVCKGDELALSFEDGLYEMVGHEQEFTENQIAAIRAIEAVMRAKSGGRNAEYWTDDAVRTHPFWEELRALAHQAATQFGWEVGPPPPPPGVYVPAGR